MRNGYKRYDPTDETIADNFQGTVASCRKKSRHLKSRLSELPEELLLQIVSKLPLKDAARTSVLARRWRYFWAYTTGSLDFDNLSRKRNPFVRSEFAEWAERILKSHKGHTLDQLNLTLRLCDNDRGCIHSLISCIHSLISHASEKNVRKLLLNFYGTVHNPGVWSVPYILAREFPHKHWLKLSSLEALCLFGLKATDEDVQTILLDCPLLESLTIGGSSALMNLRFCDRTCPRLKHLKVKTCFSLWSIELVGLINLVSFTYEGRDVRMLVKDVASLKEVHFCGQFARSLVENPAAHPWYFILPQKLGIGSIRDLFGFSEEFTMTKFPESVKLGNLKELELKLKLLRTNFNELLQWMYLVEACPMLYKLSMNIRGPGGLCQRVTHTVKEMEPRHRCLKVVEVVGFIGSALDTALVRYILKSTEAIQEIVLNTCLPERWMKSQTNSRQLVRACERLHKRLPPGADLSIIRDDGVSIRYDQFPSVGYCLQVDPYDTSDDELLVPKRRGHLSKKYRRFLRSVQ